MSDATIGTITSGRILRSWRTFIVQAHGDCNMFIVQATG